MKQTATTEVLKDKEFIALLNRPRVKIPRKELGSVSLLKHIRRLSFELPEKKGQDRISTVGIYARRYLDHDGKNVLWYLEAAKDSGFEGVSCVDDTARAVILLSTLFERLKELAKADPDSSYVQSAKELPELAQKYLNFIVYMEDGKGGILNFITDFEGTKNTFLENSQPGGIAWTSRALWALALGYRSFGGEQYKQAYLRCFVEKTEEMPYLSLLILAGLEMLQVDPRVQYKDRPVREYVHEWCDTILEHFDGYFCHRKSEGKLEREVHTYACYQLLAMAKAGAFFEDERYLQACEDTVQNFLEENAREGFYEEFPKKKGASNLYAVSSIILGLTELSRVAGTKKFSCLRSADHYANLALVHSLWMYRENDARAVMWYPDEGLCLDNIGDESNGDISAGTACGAESAIEGALVQLALNALRKKDRYLSEDR